MKWELHVGQIRTSSDSVLVLHDQPDFYVVQVDLDSKYATPLGVASGGSEVEFYVGVGEHTLRHDTDESLGPTRLTIHGTWSGAWEHLHEVGRYTWRIVGYRWPSREALEGLNL